MRTFTSYPTLHLLTSRLDYSIYPQLEIAKHFRYRYILIYLVFDPLLLPDYLPTT